MQTSVISKLIIMAVLFIMLLVPVTMIYTLVDERTDRRDEAAAVISNEWGGAQTVGGPVLSVPFRYVVDRPNGTRDVVDDLAAFLPAALQVEADVAPEIRKRGLFGVPVYRVTLTFSGHFPQPDISQVYSGHSEVAWQDARVSLTMSDPRGIAGPVQLMWNGARQQVVPGGADQQLPGGGISAPAPGVGPDGTPEIPFVASFELNGTRSLQFLPLGNDTTVSVRSPWPHPGFQGAPLPYRHAIDANGFTADWRVPFFGRGFPQSWRSGGVSRDRFAEAFQKSAFGVTLVQPVDIYQQTARAVKYAALFIVMTFVIAFLWEVIGGVMVHPVQYVFIGFALCLFYLLLLAISEHTGFDTAYISAAVATVLLIAWYWRWVAQARGRAALMLAALSALYGYLYLLLRLEDYSLLAGAVGLFLMLAAVMFLTRRVNWYHLQEQGTQGARGAGAP